MRFSGEVELSGKSATGIRVPDAVIDGLGGGRRPAVTVTVNSYTYRTTAAAMGGAFFVPLSAENRTAAGLSAGDPVEVTIELDTLPREVQVPAELAAALSDDQSAAAFYDGLAAGQRKEWARWVGESPKAQTRQARAAKAVQALREGRRTR